MFPSDARIPCAFRHAHQSRRQAPDQEYHLPRREGLSDRFSQCQGRNCRQTRQGQQRDKGRDVALKSQDEDENFHIHPLIGTDCLVEGQEGITVAGAAPFS